MPSSLASIGWPVINQIRFGSRIAIPPLFISIGFIAIGFMAGLWLLGRIGPKRGVPAEAISAIGFWSLLGAVIGARFFYVVGHYSEFSSFMAMLQIYNGGLSLLGGIAGAILINLPRVRRRGYRFFQVADVVAPALAFGIAIGRIGDLIIGDHLGTPTSWWLAWTYHGGTVAPPWVCANGICQVTLDNGRELEVLSRTGAKLLDAQGRVIAQGIGVHQTGMYDMVLTWGLFALLWMLEETPRREGILTLTFGLWYGLERILEDSVRIDKRFGPFTGSQWTSVAVVIVSASLLVWWRCIRGLPTPVRYRIDRGRGAWRSPVRGREEPPGGATLPPTKFTSTRATSATRSPQRSSVYGRAGGWWRSRTATWQPRRRTDAASTSTAGPSGTTYARSICRSSTASGSWPPSSTSGWTTWRADCSPQTTHSMRRRATTPWSVRTDPGRRSDRGRP